MPSFTMDEIKKSLGIDPTVLSTSHSENAQRGFKPMGQSRGRPIPETKRLIKTAIEEAGRPLSFPEICLYLERKQTPHLRKLLHEMADAGELVETADMAPSGMLPRFWYALP